MDSIICNTNINYIVQVQTTSCTDVDKTGRLVTLYPFYSLSSKCAINVLLASIDVHGTVF